jgi:hypothetical protein
LNGCCLGIFYLIILISEMLILFFYGCISSILLNFCKVLNPILDGYNRFYDKLHVVELNDYCLFLILFMLILDFFYFFNDFLSELIILAVS